MEKTAQELHSHPPDDSADPIDADASDGATPRAPRPGLPNSGLPSPGLPDSGLLGPGAFSPTDFVLRQPTAADGPAVAALVAACPPLDRNSPYLYLLQCSDFADFSILAEANGKVVGWISGYRRPASRRELFLWQVAVHPAFRGRRLGQKMITTLLRRPSNLGVTHIVATITKENRASWGLFETLARRWHTPCRKALRFERGRHFGGAHESEWEVKIGALPMPVPSI